MTIMTNMFDSIVMTDVFAHRIVEAWGDNVVKVVEDFTLTPIGTDTISGYTVTLVEAGSGESTLTMADATGGELLLTTDNAENDGLNIQKLGETFRVDNNSFYFGARLKISDATQSDFFIGLAETATDILGSAPKRIGFQKADESTQVSFVSKKTNTTQVTGIHTAVANTYMVLEILYNKTTGQLKFYVNGSNEYSAPITDLPDGELRLSLQFLTGSANIRTCSVDWIRAFQFGRA